MRRLLRVAVSCSWRRSSLALGLCAVVLALPAAARDLEVLELVEDFGRLWEMVLVGQASRGVQMAGVPEVRHVCHYGLGSSTFQVSRFILGRARPPVAALWVSDADGSQAEGLLAALQAEFPGRVRLAPSRRTSALGDPGRVPQGIEAPCDLAIVSQNSSRFTLERLLQRVAGQRYVAVAWLSLGCLTAEGKTSSPSCGFLNMLWDKTLLMRRGYCIRSACMSRVPVAELGDPNTFPLDCEGLSGLRGQEAARSWSSPAAEFGQDWFLAWNFFAEGHAEPRGGGFYVDVGASLPFEYSNTVVLDRCLGWQGLCIEANPGLIPWLQNYRSCEVIHNCVAESADSGHVFSGTDGGFAFAADCLPLGEILTKAGLRGQRIDVLSIDVEHGELGVLRGLQLQDFDVRTLVVEVGHGARWLEVETEVLQHGYAKVAVLGRDVVYAKLELVLHRLASGKLTWRRSPGSFHPGYAADDEAQRPLAEAKARCEGLGQRCAGVTCLEGAEAACSVRAGRTLYRSPVAEVSHTKVDGFPPLVTRGRALLPPGWREFHQRVVDEEIHSERQHEREMVRRGRRRVLS